MASTFRVDSIKQLLGAEAEISALYLASSDQPALHVLTELECKGAAVRVLAGDDPLQDLTASHNLLVIDDFGGQVHLVRDVLAAKTGPSVVASNDLNEDGHARRTKYALLTEFTYHFAGVVGGYSLWTKARRPARVEPNLLAILPPDIGALPLIGEGIVRLDKEMAPSGGVLQLTARAELQISGWAIIAQDAPSATQVFACVRQEGSGVEEYMRLSPEPRSDVSAHFQTELLLMTGFRCDISALCRRIGVHMLTIVQTDGAGRYESKPLLRFELRQQEYELTARLGLAARYLYGSGIEIGALQKPLKLSECCQVRYVDRMTIGKLLEHYPEMARFPLQAPDIVDDGQQLAHVAENSQDFVIANHFLEHCPDPIRSIHNMLRVVRQGGILYLAVPDKRHTFDVRRPATPYHALKSAYVSGQRTDIPGLFYEWAHLTCGLPPDEAKKYAEELLAEDYSIHYNVWATADLLSFLLSARQDFQIPFELIVAVSSDNENIVLLERTAGRLAI